MLKNDFDEDFSECKTKQEVIEKYLKNVEFLGKIAKENDPIDGFEFREYLLVNFFGQFYKKPNSKQVQRSRSKEKCYRIFSVNSMKSYGIFLKNQLQCNFGRYSFLIAIAVIVIVLVTFKLEASNVFMRNIQIFIYPGMRAWRKSTIPIIRTFPALTRLYDETCLVENPLFRVADLDCSPCEKVMDVVDVSLNRYHGFLDYSVPYIVKATTNSSSPRVTLSMLYKLYTDNQRIFKENALRIQSTNTRINNLDNLFNGFLNDSKSMQSSHSLWRINRMQPARLLRQLFPTPKNLPKTAGIGIERFISIDTFDGPAYTLPTTDCSNMFIYQAQGTRTIDLLPTVECQRECKRTSVRLKENFILFYDWWYWKPVSIADKIAKSTTISYIGSYC